jgi:hypothetical protein
MKIVAFFDRGPVSLVLSVSVRTVVLENRYIQLAFSFKKTRQVPSIFGWPLCGLWTPKSFYKTLTKKMKRANLSPTAASVAYSLSESGSDILVSVVPCEPGHPSTRDCRFGILVDPKNIFFPFSRRNVGGAC